MADAEGGQDVGHGFDQVRRIDAEDLIDCMSRIGQGPQDIEDRIDTQLFADGIDTFHHIIVVTRIEITEADLPQHIQAAFGAEEDIGP